MFGVPFSLANLLGKKRKAIKSKMEFHHGHAYLCRKNFCSLLVGEGCLVAEAEAEAEAAAGDDTRSRKASSCRSDSALCSVSSGRMAGTPPKPSSAAADTYVY